MSDVYRSVHKLELKFPALGVGMPVVSAETCFAENQIPTAAVNLAVGRTSDGVPAAVHMQGLNDYEPAELVLTSRGQYDKNNDWPEEPVVIFKGLVDNRSPRRGAFSVNLIHWLHKMNNSSALVSTSHPANPADLTFAAVRGSLVPGAGVQAGPTVTLWGTITPITKLGINPISIAQDVWANCYKPILCLLASQEHVLAKNGGNVCENLADGINTQALEALTLIDGPAANCTRPYACYAPPLEFRETAGITQAMAALYNATVKDTIASYLNTTLWAKLVHNYLASMLCRIVPMVEHAVVAPIVDGLRGTAATRKLIDKNDIQDYALSLSATQPLKGVGVTSSKMGKSGLRPEDIPKIVGIGGCFAPADADNNGMILFINAPRWLDNVASVDVSAVRSTKVGEVGSSAFTPVDAPQLPNAENKTRAQLSKDAVDLFREYARLVYITEKLRGRVGRVMGKLRFDISPGSTVDIISKGDPFITVERQGINEAVARVTKVICNISVAPAHASTTFELACVRTKDENEKESFSIETHPLFKRPFYGAPLIEALEFEPKC